MANGIADNIVKKYAKSPRIKKLNEQDKKNYAKLMECLSPNERCELLKGYINKAKINVTHIYLAQLMKEKFVDYILTVNFDNLMLRALALFNEFPPTHDMAILKELPTTTIDEKSIVYLHGRHHGVLQLNTENEMSEIEEPTKAILHSIKNGRPWVFIGYSGADPIFEQIKKLNRFNNHLYWVGYHDQEPERNVKEFLDTNDTTFHIKGYDADSFMLKLNKELKQKQDTILDKPFSTLQSMLGQINDIDSHEQYRGVKQRQELATKNVKKAIQQFEEGENVPIDQAEQQSDKLKKDIINILTSEKYDKKHIKSLEETANRIKDEEVNILLSSLYYNWGNDLANFDQPKTGVEKEESLCQACEKYEKATKIKPDNSDIFSYWGDALANFTQTKTGKVATTIEANDINASVIRMPKLSDTMTEGIISTWNVKIGDTISSGDTIAEIKTDKATMDFESYEDGVLLYIGVQEGEVVLVDDLIAIIGNKKENFTDLLETKAQQLYNQVFEKYEKATTINPDLHQVFNNWGNALDNLAQIKAKEDTQRAQQLYIQACEKYEKATKIKPDKHEAFNNWGIALKHLAQIKAGVEKEELLRQAHEKFETAAKYSDQ